MKIHADQLDAKLLLAILRHPRKSKEMNEVKVINAKTLSWKYKVGANMHDLLSW
jgi:hypothetical protein